MSRKAYIPTPAPLPLPFLLDGNLKREKKNSKLERNRRRGVVGRKENPGRKREKKRKEKVEDGKE
jgi:hypothetical protein